MPHHDRYDVVIIGSGAAGLSLALALPKHTRVAVLSKSTIGECATYYAQGGVSAVMDHADSVESHIEDTLGAGAGLCHRDTVEYIIKRGRERVEWLIESGGAVLDSCLALGRGRISPYP